MPSEIRAVIVDDEPLARMRLRRLCAREGGVRVLAEAGCGHEARAQVEAHRPDLLFLDVQMPEPNGLSVLAALAHGRGDGPLVVLVTAHRDYAVEAFAHDAVDYLLKPFDADRFHGAIERVRERQRTRVAARPTPNVTAPAAPARFVSRIAIKDGLRVHFVELDTLDYVAAEGNYVLLHAGARESLLRETMASMEARLDPEAFVRIHRGVIVRIESVQELEALTTGEYLLRMRDGTTLSSGRSYRKQVIDAFRL